jgi:hypothetical protein
VSHRPTLALVEPLPPAVDVGADLVARVRLACPAGCDLGGRSVRVTDPGGAIRTVELAGEAETELLLVAPAQTGDASWSVALPAEEVAGTLHEEALLTLTSSVVPHVTSVAVWDVPSPLAGSTFTVRVGIKCSVGCGLGGQRVEIHDEGGATLAEGRLGDHVRQGTTALHEAEVTLVAPAGAGVYSRRVVFGDSGPGLPHADASADFTFRVLDPPEHTVAVTVVPRGLEALMEGIEVRLGPYRAYTDAAGVARVGVPEGTYDVSIWRIDIEPWSASLEVRGDTSVEAEATRRRPVDEDAERIWM